MSKYYKPMQREAPVEVCHITAYPVILELPGDRNIAHLKKEYQEKIYNKVGYKLDWDELEYIDDQKFFRVGKIYKEPLEEIHHQIHGGWKLVFHVVSFKKKEQN